MNQLRKKKTLATLVFKPVHTTAYTSFPGGRKTGNAAALPTDSTMYSLHWIHHPVFALAISLFIFFMLFILEHTSFYIPHGGRITGNAVGLQMDSSIELILERYVHHPEL